MQNESRPLHPTSEDIARLAYAIWEHEGCPEGCAVRHWLEAETLLIKLNRVLVELRVGLAGSSNITFTSEQSESRQTVGRSPRHNEREAESQTMSTCASTGTAALLNANQCRLHTSITHAP